MNSNKNGIANYDIMRKYGSENERKRRREKRKPKK